MRIALIASPFISVPPKRYGGTELFVAHLAEGLQKRGIEVIVYANGESTVSCELRYIYKRSEWPIEGEIYGSIKDLNHTSWAIRDCWDQADIIHLNNTPGLPFCRFEGPQFAYTIHHPQVPSLSEFYSYFPDVQYVTISRFQQERETIPRVRTIHHGVDMRAYKLNSRKQPYLCFLGRIAPLKGTHLAIEVAKRAGIPLKIAGEVQPVFRSYFDSQIKPHIDGTFIEYVGEADFAAKNELLGNALAMLFPIQWNEPFGLVMIESMATGTPVLALSGGAVSEVIADGISGFICKSIDDMVDKVRQLGSTFNPFTVRRYTEKNFSVDHMVAEYAELYEGMAQQSQHGVGSATLQANEEEAIEQLSTEPEEPRAIA